MKQLCGAKTRSGGTCKHEAGWGTNHAGEGKCKLHGGASNGRPIIHGRYSVKHKESLHEKYRQFFDDEQPMILLDELALERAFLQDFLDKMTETSHVTIQDRQAVFEMTDTIGRTVERMSRMLNQSALTAIEIQFLQAVLTDLITRYIDDPDKRLRFVGELRAALTGDRGTSRAALVAPEAT